jgi:hypothetical protein
MTRPQAASLVPLMAVEPSDSLIPEMTSSTWAFRARRMGRLDDIQLGFAGPSEEAELRYIRVRIIVGPKDSWPASLFAVLGSPKRATVDQWIWAHKECGGYLKLERLQALGGGAGVPYLLEIKTMATRPPG